MPRYRVIKKATGRSDFPWSFHAQKLFGFWNFKVWKDISSISWQYEDCVQRYINEDIRNNHPKKIDPLPPDEILREIEI